MTGVGVGFAAGVIATATVFAIVITLHFVRKLKKEKTLQMETNLAYELHSKWLHRGAAGSRQRAHVYEEVSK
jgi:hypothetical protein